MKNVALGRGVPRLRSLRREVDETGPRLPFFEFSFVVEGYIGGWTLLGRGNSSIDFLVTWNGSFNGTWEVGGVGDAGGALLVLEILLNFSNFCEFFLNKWYCFFG